MRAGVHELFYGSKKGVSDVVLSGAGVVGSVWGLMRGILLACHWLMCTRVVQCFLLCIIVIQTRKTIYWCLHNLLFSRNHAIILCKGASVCLTTIFCNISSITLNRCSGAIHWYALPIGHSKAAWHTHRLVIDLSHDAVVPDVYWWGCQCGAVHGNRVVFV